MSAIVSVFESLFAAISNFFYNYFYNKKDSSLFVILTTVFAVAILGWMLYLLLQKGF